MAQSSKKSRNALLLVAGAAAGAAATYYLNTPKGKQMRTDLAAKGKNLSETVVQKVNETKDAANTRAHEAIASATDTLASAKETLIAKTNALLGTAEEEVGNFQSGINKAKRSMTNGVNV